MATTSNRQLLRVSLFAVAIACIDQIAKAFARANAGCRFDLIDGFLALSYLENSGAAFGIFPGCRIFFCTVAFTALAAGVLWRRRLQLGKPLNAICFGLIGGGIIGNLVDRLRFGYVVDFIAMGLPPFGWNTFNLADSALCGGVAIYICCELLRGKPK
ncbi:MAG: signal peptidase II [Puniceicoccales bacterium]|jgi:signal peptidase II|nr:signal peptidase II [Puniceicoccales bacterium]